MHKHEAQQSQFPEDAPPFSGVAFSGSHYQFWEMDSMTIQMVLSDEFVLQKSAVLSHTLIFDEVLPEDTFQ